MDESALEAALRSRVPDRHEAPGDCLDDSASARFAAGTMSAAERAQATEHLSHCTPCLDRIAAMIELERDEPIATDTHVIPSRRAGGLGIRAPGRFRNPATYALAASLAIAVFAGMLLARNWLPGPTDSGYREIRSASEPSAVPALHVPADGGELSRADLRFEWTALESSVGYEVELLSSAGDILWQDQTAGTDSTPPQSLYLEPGGVYYVWVRAHLHDGKTVKSPTVSFRVSREL